MGLFTQIFQNIDTHIVTYAAEKSQAVSTLIEPAVITGMGIYLAIYGYSHIKGEIEQPFMAFVDTVVKMVGITALALGVGEYNSIVIDTFQNSPTALAAALSNSPNVGSTLSSNMGANLDSIIANTIDVGVSFWNDAGATNLGGYFITPIVWAMGVAVTSYTAFLIILSKISTGVILAIGPLLIVGLLWGKTQGYCSNLINTLVGQGLVMVLAVGTNAFIISMFMQTAEDLAKLGGSAQIVDLFALFVTGAISLLVLGQVTSLASSLAGGVSLSSFGMGRAAAKLGKKVTYDKITNKRGRDNQRAAKDQIDVGRRREKLVKRAEGRKTRNNNSIEERTGTNN